ncbi:MAG: hypothetical protein Q8O41_07280 [Candidatus Methanoperedens sp.]|nr:hypothetical protein [Candidatus Methanoperedens sp.]
MFNPNFNYTHKIVNKLVEIASAREAVLNPYLVPKWEISLRRDALIRAAHASTAIEGNPLTLEEVSQLAQGRKVMAARKAKQEGRCRELKDHLLYFLPLILCSLIYFLTITPQNQNLYGNNQNKLHQFQVFQEKHAEHRSPSAPPSGCG